MPIKWIGAAIVFLSGVMWGMYKSHALLLREDSLKELITALGMLESEIVFSAHRLKLAFYQISDMCECGGLFSAAAEHLGELSAHSAWQRAVDETKKSLGINEKDAEILKLLGAELGKSDKEQQIRNIRHVSALLTSAMNEAHEEYVTSSKMYRSIGIFGGLFIAVLLM